MCIRDSSFRFEGLRVQDAHCASSHNDRLAVRGVRDPRHLGLVPDGGLPQLGGVRGLYDYRSHRGPRSGRPFGRLAAIWDKAQVSGITYSPDGKSIAVAAGAVRVLDAETLETEGELPGGDFSGRPVFAPDWSMLAVYVSDGVELWDTKGAQLKTLTTGKDTHCAAFSPDDKLLATCTGTVVKIWDVASGTDIQTLPEDVMQFRAVAFTPDGKTLIGVGSVVVFWDTSTWKQVHKTSGYGSFEALAVSPDGSLVAAGSSFDGVTVYKVATGLQQRAFSGQTLIVSLAFSPAASLIASASWANSVQVLDVASGKVVKTISVHSDRAEAVAFSPDGATLATGSLDSTLRLWRVGP